MLGGVFPHVRIQSDKLKVGEGSYFNENCKVYNQHGTVELGNDVAVSFGVVFATTAQVAFQHVDGMVAHPYHGAFSDELNFNGLADYSDVYAGELKKVEDKKEEIANIESRIYGNVLALFAIFAAIFTLVNVNAGGLSSDIATVRFVALDLLVIGGFLVLASAIETFLVKDREKKAWLPLGIGVACIVVAVILAFQ